MSIAVGQASHTLTVDVGADAATLIRILTVLRRRGCSISRVDYAASDRHRPGHLHVTVAAPRAHSHRVAAWLENLVDVRAVHRLEN